MREYTSPLIDDMDVSVEGVYAGSGSSPDIPDIPIIPPKDDPTATVDADDNDITWTFR